jgi:hypothetical protein
MMLFSLDMFEMNLGFRQLLLGLMIHNIPSILLLIIVVTTWKRPLTGGILVMLAALIMTGYFKFYKSFYPFLLFTMPLLISAGIMITYSHLQKTVSLTGKQQLNTEL